MTGAAPRTVVVAAGVPDADLAAPLFDAYRQFYGAPADLEAARQFLAARLTRQESIVLLALTELPHGATSREAVGFAQLYRSFSSLALGRIIVLNDLFVAQPWRGCGIARRLLDAVESCARGAGAVRIDLATQHGNERALRLYEARGYVRDAGFAHLSLALREDTAPATPD